MQVQKTIARFAASPEAMAAAQSAASSARQAWTDLPKIAELCEAMSRYSDTGDLGALSSLFDDRRSAKALCDAFITSQLSALSKSPFAEPGFSSGYSAGIASTQLLQVGRARLSLIAKEPLSSAAARRATSVVFSDEESIEMVVAGRGSGWTVAAKDFSEHGCRLEKRPIDFTPGVCTCLSSPNETKLVQRIDTTLVSLRLSRIPKMPEATREYRLSDGALLHRASGDRDESRAQMMLAVLGAMKRSEAVPVMAELTVSGSDQLRWAALRECLSLDTLAGFRALERIAHNERDALGPAASNLRNQLLDTYPALIPHCTRAHREAA